MEENTVMAKVEVYTTPYCPYCVAAKKMLGKKNVKYTEYDVSGDAALRDKMMERANGGHTVPQIFIDDRHIGGFDDMAEMNALGELDSLLG